MRAPLDAAGPTAGRAPSDGAGPHFAARTAPLWMPTPNWTSRSIAERLGVSQSFVARLWSADDRGEPDEPLRRALTGARLEIGGMCVGTDGCCLVLTPTPTVGRMPHTPLGTKSRRRLRTVLAADVVRPGSASEASSRDEHDERFWTELVAEGVPLAEAVVVASGDIRLPPEVVRVFRSDGWAARFGALRSLDEHAVGHALTELETRLRRWYRSTSQPFSWVAASALPEPRRRLTTHASTDPDRRLANEILDVIRHGLRHGTFERGEELSERQLALRMHCSRRRARNALLALAEEGLITATNANSVVVRLPTVDDVVETYVARRALGAIGLRAASRWSPEGKREVAACLAEIAECHEAGDVDGAQLADLRFQIALANSSGLTRIPPMLESLVRQIMMFISVLGLHYAFPSARIVEQDTQIFEAVAARDHDAAVGVWRTKMDEGLAYMLGLIEQVHGSDRRLDPGALD